MKKAESLRPEFLDKLDCFEQGEEIMSIDQHFLGYMSKKIDTQKLKETYEFLKYIIDPNKFRLRKVIRILALVMLFIRNLRKSVRTTETATSSQKRFV